MAGLGLIAMEVTQSPIPAAIAAMVEPNLDQDAIDGA
jgi:hypothetical protein